MDGRTDGHRRTVSDHNSSLSTPCSGELKMFHVGSKTRSLGQILEKPCVCSRDKIFGLILMKLGQSVGVNDILYIFENWSCRLKK